MCPYFLTLMFTTPRTQLSKSGFKALLTVNISSFAEQEMCAPNWKSIVYNLPKGTMTFLHNSLTHTLPTQDNLKRWGKTFLNKCHLCKNRDSTTHCLNGCRVALHQGRFTWRHNNIINYIVQYIIPNNGILKFNSSVLPSSKGYISQYTP